MALPSIEYLRTCFDYNPDTGIARWKQRPLDHFANKQAWSMWNNRYVGKVAGSVFQGKYYQISIDKQIYRLHRIIWKWMTGEEPPLSIDHEDLDGFNNRWTNLRSANKSQQNWNVDKREDNTSGYKGVSQAHGRWRANIRIGNVQRHLGIFSTAEDAAAAYRAAARELHGEFYREDKR